ncbi:hypothetical protein DH2020_028684 [Rehmannia glutinosa]|uniref:Molybdenum cofactor sulfurase n=1 Tax=Rehmannia glutinosa TaxID=99300 RepID=A0ABR0VTZ2_REHGL
MQSNCIREASKACFNKCCLNLPEPHSSDSTGSIDPRREFISAILLSIQPNTNFTNHESLPSLTELFSSLKTRVPYYSNTVLADDIRSQEYSHLENHVCLDYVGHGLFSYSQRQGFITATEIASSESPFFDISYNSINLNSYLLYGNQELEFQSEMRKRIIGYMNVFEEDYSSVFTANQTSAFKILADSYPFHSNQNLLTVYDYENEAVQGMVESAKKRGARAHSAVFSWPNFRVNSRKLRKMVINKSKQKNRGLFAFPLQSRMTGSRYSYQWMNLARENGWHVLLDASALGAKDMETLGLSLFQPDFLICSFFKVFGDNPSGFCCLFIKKSIFSDLNQSSTTMGIISLIPTKGSIENQTTPSSSSISQQINEETQEFQEIKEAPSSSEIVELDENPKSTQFKPKIHDTTKNSAIECRALDHADKLGLILISSRTRCLINWLVNALLTLRHPHSGNGLSLVRIYGPRIKLDRGPALAFNVYDWKGERVNPILVQKLADRNNISLNLGFLKNIWFTDDFQEEKEKVLENRRISEKKGNNKIWVYGFLDADFVEKERWRYTALNQTTVEV